MPLSSFADMLARCSATSSKNEKQAIVAEALAGEHAEHTARLLSYALSPFHRFYIQRLPDPEQHPASSVIDIALIFNALDALSTRKLTGQAARGMIAKLLAYVPHDPAAAVSLRTALQRIILKDLRAGFDASTVNKVRPGLIPTFPYMRCSLPKDVKLGEWDWAAGVVSQEKADGMFANLDISADGAVTLSSRQGTEFPMEPFAELAAEALRRLKPGTQNHGELLVMRDGVILAREIGNGILNSVAKGGEFGPGEQPIYMAWDQIPLDAVKAKGKHAVGYAERLSGINAQLAATIPNREALIRLIDTRIVHSLDDAYAHYRELLGQGKEGTIIKRHSAIWRDGTSKEQVKLKLEVDVDLEIAGFVPGNGKNAGTFGSITCRTSCGQLVVDVSGFTDAKRAELHANRNDVIGRIMTVRANSIMPPSESNNLHSLFLPRYVEIRSDKAQADSLERVKAQFASAIAA